MKKIIVLIIAIILFAFQKNHEPSDVINLKFKEIDGYGPFQQKSSSLSWTHLSDKGVWKNTEVKTIGIPKSWTKSNVDQIWFDPHQFVYQNFKQGNLNEEVFNNLKTHWKIDLNKRKLSDKPINCFVHVAIGKNQNEELEYIIDSNYNNDFSDEDILKPILISLNLDNQEEFDKSKSVIAQISTNNGIKEKEIKIVVKSFDNENLFYSLPKIAETYYQGNRILICGGFYDLTYDSECSIAIDKENTEIVALNEFIEINNHLYKNLGVNINSNELQLLKMPKDTILYSSRTGFNAKPFSVKQLEGNDSLKLNDYKGKLLYLEFWGTWCPPCIAEIPNIKDAYNKTDRNDIEFLGVAVRDTKEKLEDAIKKYDINWPQVLDANSENFKENYNVKSYPTSFLIDKNGKIIAKDLRGEKLLETINYYLKEAN